MTVQYYVDGGGNFLGGFDGASPPGGSTLVPSAPPDNWYTWNGSTWVVGTIPDSANLPVGLSQFPVIWGGSAGGTNDAKTISPSPAMISLVAGMMFAFTGGTPNTGTAAVTLNVNGLGAKQVKKYIGLTGCRPGIGEISSNGTSIVIYDGTDFILLNTVPNSQGPNVASAGTINFMNVAGNVSGGNYFHITGTTTITSITMGTLSTYSCGIEITTVFDGILTLTNGASLILLGGANITTAAGDIAVWRSEPSFVTRMVGYHRAATSP